ncbi:MAG: lactate utilization protein [Lachnospiraceae bacterium]|nr:lactate utilization protein [Lachnospiraceae bacterium]
MDERGVFGVRSDRLGQQMVKALEARHFEAMYVKTGAEAKDFILSQVPSGAFVASGGSFTIDQIGLSDALMAREDVTYTPRRLGDTPEEHNEFARRALLSDIYLASVNAITEDGVFVNVDGTGNRIGAISFGPKKVYLIVGMNKVVRTEQDAYDRARYYAAPINRSRFDYGPTPCTMTGKCGDCKSPDCICSYIVTTRLCRPIGRICVILVGESLGF